MSLHTDVPLKRGNFVGCGIWKDLWRLGWILVGIGGFVLP